MTKREFGHYEFAVADDKERYRLKFAMVEGVPWPQPIDERAYKEAHGRTRLGKGDVIVASYPKSGTTWTEQIVLLLQHGSRIAGKLRPETRNTYSKQTGLGKLWLEPMLAGTRGRRPLTVKAPRLIKSHAPFRMLMGVPRGDVLDVAKAIDTAKLRILYVARNAKDAAVSLFFQRAPVGGPRRMPMDAWASLYLSGRMSCGSYFDHVLSWYAASKVSKNILFLTYEDLIRDPFVAVKSIATFLNLTRDDAEIRKVVNASSFDAMRRKTSSQKSTTTSRSSIHAARYEIPPGTFLNNINVTSSSHLRNGHVGSWRTYFSPQLNRQFDAKYVDNMNEAARHARSAFNLVSLPPPTFDFGPDLCPRRRRR